MGRLLNLLIVMLLFIGNSTVEAQPQPRSVNGIVRDSTSAPLAGITVQLVAISNGGVLVYTQTDSIGRYSLIIPSDQPDSANLTVRILALGYKAVEKHVAYNEELVNFVLVDETLRLPEVLLKDSKPRLTISNDTTSYRVADFASVRDRTIGDVINNLPGFHVEENGRIKYNGRYINSFYIDGDDFLDDKYSIGTRTIPQTAVADIQVIENHQSIKALENKVFSDDIAINLKLTDEARLKLIGQVNLGGGTPSVYEEEGNAILLKKANKTISSVRANNIGTEMKENFLSFNELENLVRIGYSPVNAQLSTGTGIYLPLDKTRYLFNHSGSVSSANSWTLKNGFKIKATGYYLYDNEIQRYSRSSEMFIFQDTIAYNEQQYNKIEDRIGHGDVVLTVNKKDFYLNNKLAYDYTSNINSTRLFSNTNTFHQNYRYRGQKFYNELHLIKSPPDKAIIQEYYSYLILENRPESLVIDSAAYPDLFGTISKARNVNQNLETPTFYTNNFVSFRFGGGLFSQSYRAGASLEQQELNTDLFAFSPTDTLRRLNPTNGKNALYLCQLKLYIAPVYTIKTDRINLQVTLPFTYNRLHYHDTGLNANRAQHWLTMNPSVKLNASLNTSINTSLSYSISQQPSQLMQSYTGYILNNYRSISTNDYPNAISKTSRLGFSLQWKKPSSIFFANLNASYTDQKRNTISKRELSDMMSYTSQIKFDNNSRNWVISADVSKYFYHTQATASAGPILQYSYANQMVNAILLPYVNVIEGYHGKIEGKLSEAIHYRYDFKQLINKSYLEKGERASAISSIELSHEAAFDYSIGANLSFSTVYMASKSNSRSSAASFYGFLDQSVRIHIEKLKSDIELLGYNLFNVKEYKTSSVSSNNNSLGQSPLRGRIALVKASFVF